MQVKAKIYFIRGLLLLGLPFSNAVLANDVLYVCESQDGVRTYKNTNIDKNCEPLSLNPITIVPSPSERATSRGRIAPDMSDEYRPGEASLGLGSGQFESISAEQERIKIVKQELQVEEAKLRQLESEYNGGAPERQGNESNYQRYLDRKANLESEISLSNENIKLLRKELRRLTEG